MPCSNAAKKRNPLRFAGVPQTKETISAVSRPKFTILRGHVEEVLQLNKFFQLSVYIHSATDEIRRGKKEDERNHRAKI